ncbi:DUF1653 domain-containing protein [bacterium]|uniref:DUF1653 domain-containing protein n=2 Tax=Katanobacteria TaxID=422282 RepID=A0A2M7X2V1_UNCKA|nr:DUF1653 domain-containing protein [bacterium]PIP56702.1 MAG: hypothetical protein COX05_01640 [candidate division WWE3 bacterium CG22_combo_CG10-13_8_21_14_all_39_12]PJA40321.1 MAG: DUF1653 domain-containing protein [candidate division WWE3 bacterium CG_4_9_14_3_um_filter_39_7]
MSHTSQEELQSRIHDACQRVDVSATYFHYKDIDRLKPYKIVSIALDEATEEVCVVYQAQYGERLTWIRTVQDFCSNVEVENVELARFSR